MSKIIEVSILDQLKPFLNDKNVIEILIRGKNRRIKAFQKVALNDFSQSETKELLEKVLNTLNKNTGLNEKSLDILKSVVKLQNVGLVLNGLNLCATAAAFVVIYNELKEMKASIMQAIAKLEQVVKQGNDVQNEFEFNKVLSEYTDMLDRRKLEKPYSESKMRELVDGEYNVLSLLISVLQYDIAADKGAMITTLYSLLSMFSVSLCYFDEQYYFNNREALGDKEKWHAAHERWMSIYDTLSESWFIELLQDYGTFDSTLDSTISVDMYYIALMDQVYELRQEVLDNQDLIQTIGDIESLHTLRNWNNDDIKKTLEDALKKAGVDDPEAIKEYEEEMKKQAAVA